MLLRIFVAFKYIKFLYYRSAVLRGGRLTAFSRKGQFAPRSESANRTLADSLPGTFAVLKLLKFYKLSWKSPEINKVSWFFIRLSWNFI